MQIRSQSFEHGQPIPAAFAMGAADGFGGNRNPHLAWDGVPDGTRSFVLLCIDTDAPTDPALAAKPDPIPVDHVRGDFVHWVAVDLDPDLREVPACSCSDGVEKGGKRTPPGLGAARQGCNDYTGWFVGEPGMSGSYLGYDGPYPPPNDLRLHRYFFRLFALDVATLAVPAAFTAADTLRAMQGHVLAEAATQGTYTLNPRVLSSG